MIKFITILSLLFCLSGSAHATNNLTQQQNNITLVHNQQEQPCDSIVDKRAEKRTIRQQRRLERRKHRPQRDYVVLDFIGSLFVEVLIEVLIEDVLFGG